GSCCWASDNMIASRRCGAEGRSRRTPLPHRLADARAHGRRAKYGDGLVARRWTRLDCSQETDMDPRWEAVFGMVSTAILFVPLFLVMFARRPTREQIRAARERRIAAYRRSPESHLLSLT